MNVRQTCGLSCSSNAASTSGNGLSSAAPPVWHVNSHSASHAARHSQLACTGLATDMRSRQWGLQNAVPGHHSAAATGMLSVGATSQTASRDSAVVVNSLKRSRRSQYADAGERPGSSQQPLIVTVDPMGSDVWRLDAVVSLLQQGAVGIIPTDTLPAIVCDLENKKAVQRLYQVKALSEKKPLSILVRGFADISTYTLGFPTNTAPGQPEYFKLFKRLLPGAYTIILPASKVLPSQCVDLLRGKTIHRKSVGVRWPADPVCQAVLAGLGRPLLCTSVHVPEVLAEGMECPDVGSMLESYGNKGIDFVVDVGPRVAVVSSIIDMTQAEPEVVRQGAADTSMFE